MDQRFGRRWKIAFDDSGMARTGCPWHRQIDCRFGFIAPSGGSLLWASAMRPAGAKGLCELAANGHGYTLTQDGEGEASIEFDVSKVAAVATVLKARRAR